jgi:hypothetical protein
LGTVFSFIIFKGHMTLTDQIRNTMHRTIYLSLVLALIFHARADSQQLTAQRVVPREWITSWLICGPIPLQRYEDPSQAYDHLRGFTTDYLESEGGETNLHVRAGDVVSYKGGTATWQLYRCPDSIVSLEKAYPGRDYALAYAYTEVQSDRAGVWYLGLGTDDGGSLWVNGLNVWDSFLCRGVSADDDLVPVMLKKGKNTLLVKSEQWEWHWGFCVRFLPFETGNLLEKHSFFTLTTGLDGVPVITSRYDAPVLQHLVGSLNIRIFDSHQQPVFTERRERDFCGRIDMVPGEYQAYHASIGVTLKDGESRQQEVRFYAGQRAEYTLFSDGESAYRIVLGKDASASEQWAAGELQHWLKEISGVDIPVGEAGEGPAGPEIIIGYNDLVREKAGAGAPADGDESFRYFNRGPDIFIYGGKMRGTMYGVMSFLENEFGCRWYTPEVSVIPHRERKVFDRFDHSERPGINVRNDFYFEAFDPLWAARNKMNGSLSVREQPGGVECYWGVHTYYQLVPPSEFYAGHPEYYSLIDGKRDYSYGQLCLSNPDVLKIVTERIRKIMRENPGYLVYDISQNDWLNPCQCEQCQAIAKKEGGESGILLWFVNQVAEAVEEEFPGKYIGTLAYTYTRTPPGHIRPRHNVVIRLCSVECCFAHDFRNGPENRSFLRDLEGWSAIAPNLYIWDYVVNFRHYLMPYPNFGVLQPNIRALRDNHVIGIMEQGASVKGGEFSELRTYLISKLLWDPDCNADDVIDDFMSGYYGRSGRYIRQYFDLLQGCVTPETHIHIFDNLAFDAPVFSDRFIRDSYEIFEQARKVADNGEILKRVERASLPVLYLKCLRMPRLAKYDGTYASFCAITEREGVEFFGEGPGEPKRNAFHRFMENAK